MNNNPDNEKKLDITEPEVSITDEFPVTLPEDYDPDTVDYSQKRSVYGVPSDADPVYSGKYQRQKLKGKEAVENYWYHYGKITIIVLICAAVLSYILYMSRQTPYDCEITVFADINMGSDGLHDLSEQVKLYSDDVNGDGQILVNACFYNRNSPDPNIVQAAYVVIQTDLSDNYRSPLIVMDKEHYEFIVTQAYGREYFDEFECFPDGIPLKDAGFVTDIAKDYGTKDPELYLLLVKLPENDPKVDDEIIAIHDNAREIINRILAENPQIKAE